MQRWGKTTDDRCNTGTIVGEAGTVEKQGRGPSWWTVTHVAGQNAGAAKTDALLG